MNLNKMYGLFLRHFFLIRSSLPRILDLIYWPTIQIILWGFISKFFSIYSNYYNDALGVILTCAILYDILFRSSISFNMLFLEEIWSRNFTNLFIAPLKIKEGPNSNKETPKNGVASRTAGTIPIKVLINAVAVRAVIISLFFKGAINKLVKFLLHISSKKSILKLILDLKRIS